MDNRDKVARSSRWLHNEGAREPVVEQPEVIKPAEPQDDQEIERE
jgi:hypothetical protein